MSEKRTLPTLDLKRHYAQIEDEIIAKASAAVEALG